MSCIIEIIEIGIIERIEILIYKVQGIPFTEGIAGARVFAARL